MCCPASVHPLPFAFRSHTDLLITGTAQGYVYAWLVDAVLGNEMPDHELSSLPSAAVTSLPVLSPNGGSSRTQNEEFEAQKDVLMFGGSAGRTSNLWQ